MAKSPSERHFYFHMHNASLGGKAHSSSHWNHIHTINHAHTIYIAYPWMLLLQTHTLPKKSVIDADKWKETPTSQQGISQYQGAVSDAMAVCDLTLTCVSLTPITQRLFAVALANQRISARENERLFGDEILMSALWVRDFGHKVSQISHSPYIYKSCTRVPFC